MNSEIAIIQQSGQGRSFFILHENDEYTQHAERLFDLLVQKNKVVLARSIPIKDDNWNALTEQLRLVLQELKIRQTSFITFGAASALVQNLCVKDIKLARTMVFVDAETRPHPSQFQRSIDWIESHLPLGLPLRSNLKAFDAKPFLQRLRCPVLVMTSRQASDHVRSEAALMSKGLPSAWWIDVANAGDKEIELISDTILQFQDVPAKCPQKRNVENAA